MTAATLWGKVNIGSGNALVPAGNKTSPEPMLTQIYVAIWHQLPQLVNKVHHKNLALGLHSVVVSYRSIVSLSFKAHLHYIWDLRPSIWVRARTQSKQVSWCFVFTLIRVRVRDFCLGRPCPSSSRTSEFIRGCAMHMLKAACARSRYCGLTKWPWPRM